MDMNYRDIVQQEGNADAMRGTVYAECVGCGCQIGYVDEVPVEPVCIDCEIDPLPYGRGSEEAYELRLLSDREDYEFAIADRAELSHLIVRYGADGYHDCPY